MSDSFSIGKNGIIVLQGTGSPTGIDAPAGSIFLQKDGNGDLFRMGATDWVRMLDIDRVTYMRQFVASDLTGGILTVTHALGTQWPIVQVWDDSNRMIIPDSITSPSTTTVVVDLSSLTVANTWRVRVSL